MGVYKLASLPPFSPCFHWCRERCLLEVFAVPLTVPYHSSQAQPRIPSLVQMAIPHLPPPIPTYIRNAFQWLQIGTLFLDDVAVFIVGLGVVVYASAWLI
jgi:hypothetical protein